MQCGPENDDLWDKAEQETELAKKEACNVKVQINRTSETAEAAASRKREVSLHWHQNTLVLLSLPVWWYNTQTCFACLLDQFILL